MIAAFLRTVDGDFNFVALFYTILALLFGIAMLFYLPKTIRSGRIHFEWTPRTAQTVSCDIERDKNPFLFWFLFIFYCFGIVAMFAYAIVICFGLLRPH